MVPALQVNLDVTCLACDCGSEWVSMVLAVLSAEWQGITGTCLMLCSDRCGCVSSDYCNSAGSYSTDLLV